MKSLMILVLIAAVGAGMWFAFGGDDGAGPVPGQPQVVEDPADPQPTEPDTPPDAVAVERGGNDGNDRERVEVKTPSSAEAAQGVLGRVVDPTGTPVAGVNVYLVKGHGKDIFTAMMLAQKGVYYPPIAEAATNEMGEFRVGVQQVDDAQSYELRFTSDRFADHTLPGIKLFAERWYDAETIKLTRGTVLQGRVTAQGTNGLPIADAEISVKVTSAFPSLNPTPGREKGIIAISDEGGFFRFDNIKPGIVTVSALAPGFAKVERANMQIAANGDNKADFELPKGLSIAGVVTDADGVPVPNSKVSAVAISAKTPMTQETRSDEAGKFELLGLVEGPFQLSATAPGFVQAEVKPVPSGTMDQHVVLERQGSARLRVISKTNKEIRNYRVLVKTYFEGSEHFGNRPGSQMEQVTGRDLVDGLYEISGLDPGSYVAEVHAKGYAKTYSEPFVVALGGEPPTTIVRMNEGGTLTGTVTDASGTPLGGVSVMTMPNFLDENPFTSMFGAMVPYKITRGTWKTNAKGQFKIPLLAPGTYQLKFSHPQHYDIYLKEQEVGEALTTQVAQIQMDRGTVVSGTVRVDGQPKAQVKVTVSSVIDPNNPSGAVFSTDAVTDNDGNFELPRRLPPGNYEARAARQTLGNPLLQVVDFAKTQQQFSVMRGQDTHVIHFSMTSDGGN